MLDVTPLILFVDAKLQQIHDMTKFLGEKIFIFFIRLKISLLCVKFYADLTIFNLQIPFFHCFSRQIHSVFRHIIRTNGRNT